jgi:hypothetical protein
MVKDVQVALVAGGLNIGTPDGVYGNNTAAAVKTYQASKGLPVSGSVDESTWQGLLKTPVPTVAQRALALTASFEGHGFELAVGNFDGALLTWGIIGFTLASGEIPEIINSINASTPGVLAASFGSYTQELLNMLNGTSNAQTEWANQHTLDNGSLAEPWRSMFASLGRNALVQQAQIKRAEDDYLAPAIQTAEKLGLTSELALALLFDIHVQNGGIKKAVLGTITSAITSGMSESNQLQLIANCVADSASPKWREDVRIRKLTIARGQGIVHGHSYQLENWGLSIQFQAEELTQAAAAMVH